MRFTIFFLIPLALASPILQDPGKTNPHRPPYDIDDVLASRPYNAFESKSNNNPGRKDLAQRKSEDFREQQALEYGVKDKDKVHGHRGSPLRDITNKQVLADVNRKNHEANDRQNNHAAEYGGGCEAYECYESYGGYPVSIGCGRPTVELGFGYNKGSKYDNGYGHLRAYDRGIIDIGTVGELAVGLGADPNYLWGDDKMPEGYKYVPVDPDFSHGHSEG